MLIIKIYICGVLIMNKKLLGHCKISLKENLISLAIIGSYHTEFWVEGRSDIDILVLVNKKIGSSHEFDMEDYLTPILEDYFAYKNIHLTFLYSYEFGEELAQKYIYSKDKIVFDELKEIDFRLYVNKYIRNNEWLINLIKEDTKRVRSDKNDTLL